MKKQYFIITLFFTLLLLPASSQAQSFLKKLSKGIENVTKQIDKVLDTGTETSSSGNITISTPHKLLQVNLVSAEMSGDNFVMEFTITNKGEDIKDYRLTGCFGGCGQTKAYDNLGNECRVDIVFGTSESWHGGTAGSSLLSDTPTKVKVILSGFSSKATSFTQIRIKGEAWDYGKKYSPNGDFIFKNVPIVKNEAVEVSMPSSSQSLSIPETKLGMTYWTDADYNKYRRGKKITQQERTQLKIDNMKGDGLSSRMSNKELVRGKTIYQGQNGRIESIVVVYDLPGEGQEYFEYMVSYDAAGNYVDQLEVGCQRLYASDEASAIVKGSDIALKYYYSEPGEEEVTTLTTYQISPQLKFNKIKTQKVQ